jgi:hypothetical protein
MVSTVEESKQNQKNRPAPEQATMVMSILPLWLNEAAEESTAIPPVHSK